MYIPVSCSNCIPRLVRYLPCDRKCQGVGVFYQHEIPHTNSNPGQQNLPNIYKAGRVVYMYSKMILSSSLHNCSSWEYCSPKTSSSDLILPLEMHISKLQSDTKLFLLLWMKNNLVPSRNTIGTRSVAGIPGNDMYISCSLCT